MKLDEFDKIKPGMQLYKMMDIGKIFFTVDKTWEENGIKYIMYVGDKRARTWEGQHGRLYDASTCESRPPSPESIRVMRSLKGR